MRLLIVLFFLLVAVSGSTQNIFGNEDLSTFRANDLSSEQLSQLKTEIAERNLSISELEIIATAKGVAPLEFSILRERLSLLGGEKEESSIPEKQVTDVAVDKENAEASIKQNDGWVYGSEIFQNNNLSFEPNQSLPTPQNYTLGPGDELEIIIYGVQQFAQSIIVNKDGKVFLSNIGSVPVGGLDLGAADKLIRNKAKRIYSTLATGESELSISVSNLRSIQVTMIGVENPGNYTLSSLSTVFNALHVAGGPSRNGSYRAIELIRGGDVLKTIDLYEFLSEGNITSNISLEGDDIIRVPVYKKRVEVLGKVKRPGMFELSENETFDDLLKYCSGYSENAYKKSVQLTTLTPTERKLRTIPFEQLDTITIHSGDIFRIDPILNSFENRVKISGAVHRPSEYELKDGMTVYDVILMADGVTDDAFLNRAVLIRKGKGLQKEVIGFNLDELISSNGKAENLLLMKDDELFISSIFDLQEEKTVSINGQIMNSGKFPFFEKITLYDLILQAGGFTEDASTKIEIARVIKGDSTSSGDSEAEIIRLELGLDYKAQSENIILKPFDIVSVRKIENYKIPISAIITGEINSPGSYAISETNEKIGDMIARAGMPTDKANLNGIKIIRKSKIDSTEIIIPINYDKITKRPNSKANITVREGDIITISQMIQTTLVSGAVEMKTEIPIEGSKRAKYYINSSGGFKENAAKKKTYVVYANGIAKKTKNFGLFRIYPKPDFGSKIVVPTKPEKDNRMSTQEVVALSGVLSSITGITIAIISLLQP